MFFWIKRHKLEKVNPASGVVSSCKIKRAPFSLPSSLESLLINVIRRLLSQPYRKSNDFNTPMRIETSLIFNELDMVRRPRTEVGDRSTVSVFPRVFNCGFL